MVGPQPGNWPESFQDRWSRPPLPDWLKENPGTGDGQGASPPGEARPNLTNDLPFRRLPAGPQHDAVEGRSLEELLREGLRRGLRGPDGDAGPLAIPLPGPPTPQTPFTGPVAVPLPGRPAPRQAFGQEPWQPFSEESALTLLSDHGQAAPLAVPMSAPAPGALPVRVPDFHNAPGVQFAQEADGSFTGVVTTNPHHVLREAQARGFKALGNGYLGPGVGNWVRFAPAALAPSLQKGPYRPQEASQVMNLKDRVEALPYRPQDGSRSGVPLVTLASAPAVPATVKEAEGSGAGGRSSATFRPAGGGAARPPSPSPAAAPAMPKSETGRGNTNGMGALLSGPTYTRGPSVSKYPVPEPKPNKPFPAGVVKVMDNIGKHLWIDGNDRLSRLVAIRFIGEENQTVQERGALSFVDKNQDTLARYGLRIPSPFDYVPPDHGDFRHFVPEFMKRGEYVGDVGKLIAQLDSSHHDVGPININLLRACEVWGVTKTDEVGMISKIIVTDEGSASFLSLATPEAVADLMPLISSKDIMEQSQIVVDYLRQGRDRFWKRVGDLREMSPEQLDLWKRDPAGFKMPDGSAPPPLAPSRRNPYHDEQVRDAEARLKPKERAQSYFK